LAEAWQHFIITVTAVTVLTCIEKSPLLYSPQASCYMCNFLSKYFRLGPVILNEWAVKQHLARDNACDLII
jgi:hypothetical protein